MVYHERKGVERMNALLYKEYKLVVNPLFYLVPSSRR